MDTVIQDGGCNGWMKMMKRRLVEMEAVVVKNFDEDYMLLGR